MEYWRREGGAGLPASLTNACTRTTHEEGAGERSSSIARFLALAGLIGAVVLVALLLFSGGGDYKVTATFSNGGQLVKGNQVRVGGRPVGVVDKITLNDESQAVVVMSLEKDFGDLHRGTTATIRSNSLSGIANRYVSLAPGPDSNAEGPQRRQDHRRRHQRAGGPGPAVQHARPQDHARACRT